MSGGNVWENVYNTVQRDPLSRGTGSSKLIFYSISYANKSGPTHNRVFVRIIKKAFSSLRSMLFRSVRIGRIIAGYGVIRT